MGFGQEKPGSATVLLRSSERQVPTRTGIAPDPDPDSPVLPGRDPCGGLRNNWDCNIRVVLTRFGQVILTVTTNRVWPLGRER
jgi:hypothetical protein